MTNNDAVIEEVLSGLSEIKKSFEYLNNHQEQSSRESAQLSGALEEVARQINHVSGMLQDHVSDESSVMLNISEKLVRLDANSESRHRVLNDRMDRIEDKELILEKHIELSRIRWGIVIGISGAVGAISVTVFANIVSGHLAFIVYYLKGLMM